MIIGKLLAWEEGRSIKHPQDIGAMLALIYSGRDQTIAPYFDESYVDRRAGMISGEAWKLWQDLKKQARTHKE